MRGDRSDEGGQTVQTSSYEISHRELKDSIVSTASNTVLHICKLLRENIFKVQITRKKISNYVC